MNYYYIEQLELIVIDQLIDQCFTSRFVPNFVWTLKNISAEIRSLSTYDTQNANISGIWAVVNTSGLSYRGRLDQQDIAHWDAMLKTNVIGILRTARKFQSLLRNSGGRIVTLGATENLGTGLVAYAASRYAVEGASRALRQELSSVGIKVVTVSPQGILPELLFSTPKLNE